LFGLPVCVRCGQAAFGVELDQRKRCPGCAEAVKHEAVTCSVCGKGAPDVAVDTVVGMCGECMADDCANEKEKMG
jgi:predicted amidophosphoribosyltransferase